MKEFFIAFASFILFSTPFFASAAPIRVAFYYTQTDFEAVGDAASRTCIAQQFSPSSTVNVTAIGVYDAVVSSPADQIQVNLYADSGGHPGTLLETGTNLTFSSTSFTWATSTFAGTTLVSSGTNYWVGECRTGSISGTSYYKWGVSNSSITNGNIDKFDGSSWSLDFSTFNADFEVDGTTPVASAASNFFSFFWW